MKKAICQVADTGPLESLVMMLRTAGYEVWLPDAKLKRALTDLGCDTVADVAALVSGMGYDQPMALRTATLRDMDDCDLYVDVKAHRNGPKIWEKWPRLKDRTLFYRINGGAPEHVIRRWTDKDGVEHVEDCGDEVNLPCPILTPNLWYHCEHCNDQGEIVVIYPHTPYPQSQATGTREVCPECVGRSKSAYAVWPPFMRFAEYHEVYGRHTFSRNPTLPVCLIHRIEGWGYKAILDNMRKLGVRCYGAGSPDGLVQHRDVPKLLSECLAMVHLKSNDCPGYALYEALAAGCPIVLTRRLIWRMRMQDLFVPGETCLVFDRETHDGLSEEDIVNCTREVHEALNQLQDPAENRRIGMAGHDRLKELMWDAKRDGQSLNEFMQRNYP